MLPRWYGNPNSRNDEYERRRYDERDSYRDEDRRRRYDDYDDRYDRYERRDPRSRNDDMRDDRYRRRYDDYDDGYYRSRNDYDRDRDYDRGKGREPPKQEEDTGYTAYDWERKDYVPPEPPKIDWNYKPPVQEEKPKPEVDRNVVVTLKHRAVRPAASQLPELSDAFYKINASDILMMRKSRLEQGTFRKAGAAPRKIARCRFQFDGPFQDLSIDATFDVNEYSEELYKFLQGHVFTPDTQLRIFTPFPVVQIQNNNLKTLSSFNVSGNILLTVNLKEHPVLCPEMRAKYKQLKDADEAEKAQKDNENKEKVAEEEKNGESN